MRVLAHRRTLHNHPGPPRRRQPNRAAAAVHRAPAAGAAERRHATEARVAREHIPASAPRRAPRRVRPGGGRSRPIRGAARRWLKACDSVAANGFSSLPYSRRARAQHVTHRDQFQPLPARANAALSAIDRDSSRRRGRGGRGGAVGCSSVGVSGGRARTHRRGQLRWGTERLARVSGACAGTPCRARSAGSRIARPR